MISLVVHKDRLQLNNSSLKDYAIATLSNHPSLASERSTLLFQFGNEMNFIYFLLPENIPLAVSVLKEGHAGYLKIRADLIEQNRKWNVKLQIKDSTVGLDRVVSQGEAEKMLLLRQNPQISFRHFGPFKK